MWYLKSAFDTYQTVQSAVQDRIGNMQSALLAPVESMKRLLGGASQSPEDNQELSALRRRVAELEARLQKTSKRKNRRTPA